MQWDRKREGRYSIRASGGSVIIKGCNFITDSPQVFIGEETTGVIVTGNIVKGGLRIDNHSEVAIVKDNLSAGKQGLRITQGWWQPEDSSVT